LLDLHVFVNDNFHYLMGRVSKK